VRCVSCQPLRWAKVILLVSASALTLAIGGVLAQNIPSSAVDVRVEQIATQYQQMCEQGLEEAQQRAAASSPPNAPPWGSLTARISPKSFCRCVGNAIRAKIAPQMLDSLKQDQIQALIARDGERCGAEASKAAFPSICPTWIDQVEQPPMPSGISTVQKAEACRCIQARYSEISPDTIVSLGRKAELGNDLAAEQNSLQWMRAECLRKVGIIH
jgi:hypothetical protein